MGKRKIKRGEATFSLQSDGYSVHTLELCRRLTPWEFTSVKAQLYEETTIYRYECGKKESYRCLNYERNGIRVSLVKRIEKSGNDLYYLMLIVNPRKVIDPQSSYLGILTPTEGTLRRFADRFQKVLRKSPIPNEINAYHLHRIDLCCNIHCDHNGIFREFMRVSEKLEPIGPLTRNDHRKEDRDYSKNYICFQRKSYSLVFYNKGYQMVRNGLVSAEDDLSPGVLRYEMQCASGFLQAYQKKHGMEDTYGLIEDLMNRSRDIMIRYFEKAFPYRVYYKAEKVIKAIDHSKYRKEVKEQMSVLISVMQKEATVCEGCKVLRKRFGEACIEEKKLLRKFAGLLISPVPLRKNAIAEELPALAALLADAGKGKRTVAYRNVKYK